MKKRVWAVLLLFLSCITAILLLAQLEPVPRSQITTPAQLDSLITLALSDFGLPPSQVQRRSVQIDSVFTRNIYTARVPPDFSKTSFHYHLHRELLPFNGETAGRVAFPERNLRIHIIVNNTVHRTVLLHTDPRLQLNHNP